MRAKPTRGSALASASATCQGCGVERLDAACRRGTTSARAATAPSPRSSAGLDRAYREGRPPEGPLTPIRHTTSAAVATTTETGGTMLTHPTHDRLIASGSPAGEALEDQRRQPMSPRSPSRSVSPDDRPRGDRPRDSASTPPQGRQPAPVRYRRGYRPQGPGGLDKALSKNSPPATGSTATRLARHRPDRVGKVGCARSATRPAATTALPLPRLPRLRCAALARVMGASEALKRRAPRLIPTTVAAHPRAARPLESRRRTGAPTTDEPATVQHDSNTRERRTTRKKGKEKKTTATSVANRSPVTSPTPDTQTCGGESAQTASSPTWSTVSAPRTQQGLWPWQRKPLAGTQLWGTGPHCWNLGWFRGARGLLNHFHPPPAGGPP